jgi:hypothetical protein
MVTASLSPNTTPHPAGWEGDKPQEASTLLLKPCLVMSTANTGLSKDASKDRQCYLKAEMKQVCSGQCRLFVMRKSQEEMNQRNK